MEERELSQSVLPRCRIVSPSSIRERSARYDEASVRNSSEVKRIEAAARFSSR
jgi:hypothetical protein